MSVAVQLGKIMLRGAYRLLATKIHWESTLTLDADTIDDFQWWVKELLGSKKRVLVKKTVDFQVTTDASRIGWGAHSLIIKQAGIGTFLCLSNHPITGK